MGCGGDRIRWVLCTHTHSDHSTLAPALAERTGAEILAYDSRDGLEVDRALGDGDRLDGTEFRLTSVHTPGHASNHLCFLLEQELFQRGWDRDRWFTAEQARDYGLIDQVITRADQLAG